MCIGRIPNATFDVKVDEQGYIITDDTMETSIKGVYAIGDVRQKEVRQLTTAAADGTIAVSSIIKN
jgi:thioredoxin reductase (NADPH)